MGKAKSNVYSDVYEEYRRIEHEVVMCNREIEILSAKKNVLHEIETRLHCILCDYGKFSYPGYIPTPEEGET